MLAVRQDLLPKTRQTYRERAFLKVIKARKPVPRDQARDRLSTDFIIESQGSRMTRAEAAEAEKRRESDLGKADGIPVHARLGPRVTTSQGQIFRVDVIVSQGERQIRVIAFADSGSHWKNIGAKVNP